MQQLQKIWHPDYGDRRQELVFIGIGLDEAAMRARLDACLLTPQEPAPGRTYWRTLADPFTPWPLPDDQDRAA